MATTLLSPLGSRPQLRACRLAGRPRLAAISWRPAASSRNAAQRVQAAGGGAPPGGGRGGTGDQAGPSAAPASSSIPPQLSPLQQLVSSPFYRIWLQLGVVLLLAMLVDAAYSGDWSRIGVLTKEQELALQQVAVAVGCFHLACGATAAAVSSRRGEAWAPRTAKVLAVGFLALLEVLLLPEEGGAAAGGDGGGGR